MKPPKKMYTSYFLLKYIKTWHRALKNRGMGLIVPRILRHPVRPLLRENSIIDPIVICIFFVVDNVALKSFIMIFIFSRRY